MLPPGSFDFSSTNDEDEDELSVDAPCDCKLNERWSDRFVTTSSVDDEACAIDGFSFDCGLLLLLLLLFCIMYLFGDDFFLLFDVDPIGSDSVLTFN